MEDLVAIYKDKGYVAFGVIPKYLWLFGLIMFIVLVLGSWAGAKVEQMVS